jgi:VanZ family protein
LTPVHPVSKIERWWPALAWAGLLLGLSSIPGSRLDDVGLRVPDKLVHALEYGVFAALVLRGSSRGAHVGRREILGAVVVAALLGAIDENYQRLIPQREPSLADWVADITGATGGAWFAASGVARRLRSRRRSG